jgi:hypothetical protein
MSTLETGEAPHDWTDVDHWRAELERKPPDELAAAAHLWHRAVALRWLQAAGASLCCTDGRVLLPPDLPECPAAVALRHLAREIEEERTP